MERRKRLWWMPCPGFGNYCPRASTTGAFSNLCLKTAREGEPTISHGSLLHCRTTLTKYQCASFFWNSFQEENREDPPPPGGLSLSFCSIKYWQGVPANLHRFPIVSAFWTTHGVGKWEPISFLLLSALFTWVGWLLFFLMVPPLLLICSFQSPSMCTYLSCWRGELWMTPEINVRGCFDCDCIPKNPLCFAFTANSNAKREAAYTWVVLILLKMLPSPPLSKTNHSKVSHAQAFRVGQAWNAPFPFFLQPFEKNVWGSSQ